VRRGSLATLFAIVFIDLMGFGIVIPLLPLYGERYHPSALAMGMLLSAFSATQFAAAPVLGRLSDRFGRKPVLLFSLAGSVAGYLLFAAAHSLAMLFAARIIDGISGGNISTAGETQSQNEVFGNIFIALGVAVMLMYLILVVQFGSFLDPLAILISLPLSLIGVVLALIVTRDLSLKLEAGARHALIGPNGAGKTTVINLLTGVLKPNAGRILLEGNDITDLPVHRRVLRGLSRTFQINQLYADLTPLETIGLAVSERLGRGGDWWRGMATRDDVNAEIAENLARFHLLDVMNDPTATLPYGKQRLLEIAVAIAAKPRVLLLDEPAAGVPESERHDILAVVAALPRDVTVLLIEHDMDLVFSFADRISVLVNGALLVEGPPGEVARDARVKSVYLGEAADA